MNRTHAPAGMAHYYPRRAQLSMRPASHGGGKSAHDSGCSSTVDFSSQARGHRHEEAALWVSA